MTDLDLAPLAKAGVAWAVNELLRRALPEVRSVVGFFSAQLRTSFSIREEALGEALLAVWRSIPAWDPQRASLVGFARQNIYREVRRVASAMGHAVGIPEAAPKKRKGHAAARMMALTKARGMEEPVYESPDGDLIVTHSDLVTAQSLPLDERIDAARILTTLPARDAEILWRFASGETYAEIAEDSGQTKQCVEQARERAIVRAKRAAAACFRRTA